MLGERSEERRTEATKAAHEPSRANLEAKTKADLPRWRSDKQVLILSGSTWWCGLCKVDEVERGLVDRCGGE